MCFCDSLVMEDQDLKYKVQILLWKQVANADTFKIYITIPRQILESVYMSMKNPANYFS